MAQAAGRRPDETSSDERREQGPELWALVVITALMVLAVVALIALAAR
jgi:hypothetical protein